MVDNLTYEYDVINQIIPNDELYNSSVLKNNLFVCNLPNCMDPKCLIHNFPERELIECVISLENTLESIMTPDTIKMCNDFIRKSYSMKYNDDTHWVPITYDNLYNFRFNKNFIEFIHIYNNLHNDKKNKLTKLTVIVVDYRYAISKCIDFIIGKNNNEICLLNHKKFSYKIFNKLIITKCLYNNMELVLQNFAIFMNKLYYNDSYIYNNTYNIIDKQWIKQYIKIITMKVDPKIKIDYLQTIFIKDIIA
jgi:hypothetical protein